MIVKHLVTFFVEICVVPTSARRREPLLPPKFDLPGQIKAFQSFLSRHPPEGLLLLLRSNSPSVPDKNTPTQPPLYPQEVCDIRKALKRQRLSKGAHTSEEHFTGEGDLKGNLFPL